MNTLGFAAAPEMRRAGAHSERYSEQADRERHRPGEARQADLRLTDDAAVAIPVIGRFSRPTMEPAL
jgi:hypothetical protein